jgi:hypothetical protein
VEDELTLRDVEEVVELLPVAVDVVVVELLDVVDDDAVEVKEEVLVAVLVVVVLLVVDEIELVVLVVVEAGSIPKAVPKYISAVDRVAVTLAPVTAPESCSHSAYTVGLLE